MEQNARSYDLERAKQYYRRSVAVYIVLGAVALAVFFPISIAMLIYGILSGRYELVIVSAIFFAIMVGTLYGCIVTRNKEKEKYRKIEKAILSEQGAADAGWDDDMMVIEHSRMFDAPVDRVSAACLQAIREITHKEGRPAPHNTIDVGWVFSYHDAVCGKLKVVIDTQTGQTGLTARFRAFSDPKLNNAIKTRHQLYAGKILTRADELLKAQP